MRRKTIRPDKTGGVGGDFWAGYSDLMAGLLLVFIFITAASRISRVQLVENVSEQLKQWRGAITALCRDQELLSQGVKVDCETGVIELPDQVFFGYNRDDLNDDGRRKLRVAIPIVLRELRRQDLVWERLDVIEVRGHADPCAQKFADRYLVNLEKSLTRARSVLLFLTVDPGIPDADRAALSRKGVAAGSSYMRPPESGAEAACPEGADKDSYHRWRRVEILLNFDDRRFRSELNHLLDQIRTSL